ncbi:uncharacterized protein LOC108806424 isoform X2 [Raphanus sativus]|uniref:Uncharacterized protein LOC108806424 isoform X2 n=1 Tax=Raphanus sativus TaxID=3726 RepID=A0A9W3BXU1_RAPSA|nr:uncharacterized protein LOC108806424 isoform X2 [Raphanus sativus]
MDQSKLKRCSASSSSSHAEAAADATDSLQKERELDDSETEFNSRKKQKQEEEETAEKKKRCCFGTKDAKGNDERTIFVSGFDNSGSRDEIRSALAKHFSSCGELTRVFVHIECKTGVSRGYAFINLKQRGGGEELEAALTLNGSDLGGRKLLVTMAKSRDEYYGHFNYTGCEICRAMFAAGRLKMYKWKRETGGGQFISFSPEFEEKFRLRKKELMASPEFRLASKEIMASRKMEKSLNKKKKRWRSLKPRWRSLKPKTANISTSSINCFLFNIISMCYLIFFFLKTYIMLFWLHCLCFKSDYELFFYKANVI